MAQIDNGMDFTTAFSFYAGNAKMPAGSYRITQTDVDTNELSIQSADGKYPAFAYRGSGMPSAFRWGRA
jgi:hypothetical protein